MLPRRLITTFLIALWLLTPDVLCLLPGVTLTADEHECCEQMLAQCGMIPMPALHTCCQTVKRSDDVIRSEAMEYPEPQAEAVAFITPEFDIHDIALSRHGLAFESPTPPPLTSRDSFDILRI